MTEHVDTLKMGGPAKPAHSEGRRQVAPDVIVGDPLTVDPDHRRVRQLAYISTASGPVAAAVTGAKDLTVVTVKARKALIGPSTKEESRLKPSLPIDGEITAAILDGRGEDVFLGTSSGQMARVNLREYARQGPFVSAVRIAVNNLAGVPSIVFGVFGVGFFIYTVGGTIDRVFFPEALPSPTFGTGGILWASLTLALLTVLVVIVATEEGLAAIPGGMREASLALGATKFETTWRVFLPTVTPSILTGLILAMPRAAGEVAPLMITGVVKLAPALPIDGFWPFIHLERKFMHRGFHIYDVGFQSPNVDAARPMVFTTAMLLLSLVMALNLTATALRNRLRRTYATSVL